MLSFLICLSFSFLLEGFFFCGFSGILFSCFALTQVAAPAALSPYNLKCWDSPELPLAQQS
jgi:hypothetical protein